MSRYLYVPKTITLKKLATEKVLTAKNEKTGKDEPVTVSFYSFLVGTLLKNDKFGANALTIMHAIEIKDKVKAAKEGTHVELEDEAWELLNEAAKNPSIPFNPEIAMQLGTFLTAILEASTEKPEIKRATKKKG